MSGISWAERQGTPLPDQCGFGIIRQENRGWGSIQKILQYSSALHVMGTVVEMKKKRSQNAMGHQLDGPESEWTLGVGDGQGGLACCSSWGHKELDTTKRLNWTELDIPITQVTWKKKKNSTLCSKSPNDCKDRIHLVITTLFKEIYTLFLLNFKNEHVCSPGYL